MGRAIDSPVSPFITFIAPSNAVVWAMVDFVSLHTPSVYCSAMLRVQLQFSEHT